MTVCSLKTRLTCRFTDLRNGERGFCSNCGSSLFWKLHGGNDYNVSLLAFDDLDDVKFTTEYFIDGKPDAYAFANETSKLTGEQVFALFSQGQDH